jgi:hypothetical protein
MLSRTFFYAMTMATMTVVVVMATAVVEATDDRVRFHGSGQLSEADDLDKTGTTGGRENNNGPQVLCCKALASRVSFKADRTGFAPAVQLPGHGFSKPALSTTQPPLQTLYTRAIGLFSGFRIIACDTCHDTRCHLSEPLEEISHAQA